MASSNFKCHFCTICNGTGCIGQIPGMGGVNRNVNFRLNCDGWEVCRKENPLLFVNFLEKSPSERKPNISIAPITGAVENIGFFDEKEYYFQMFNAAHQVGLGLCVGDGFPDDKIKFGIQAIKNLQDQGENVKAAFFIKPFENSKIIEHITMALPYANAIGIDIDSYNITTMKNKVELEKKNCQQLLEIRDFIKSKSNLPFAIKGIFTKESVELVSQVRPEIAYISNHGGRVDTAIGSTAEFLQNYSDELKSYGCQIWVDGGIRSSLDVTTAMAFGADRILIGRPFVSAFCKGGKDLLCKKVLELSLLQYGK